MLASKAPTLTCASLPRGSKCLQPRRQPRLAATACLQCHQPPLKSLVTEQPQGRQLKAYATRAPEREQGRENIATAREPPEDNSEPPQPSAGVRVALAVLNFYKAGISPLLPPSCRFIPTCSSYAMEAYTDYGVAKGTVLTAWRLLRCNPFGKSGYDPVSWPPPGLEWMFKA